MLLCIVLSLALSLYLHLVLLHLVYAAWRFVSWTHRATFHRDPYNRFMFSSNVFVCVCKFIFAKVKLARMYCMRVYVCVARTFNKRNIKRISPMCVLFHIHSENLSPKTHGAYPWNSKRTHTHAKYLDLVTFIRRFLFSFFFACNLKERKMSSERTRKTFIRMCIGRHSVHLYHMTRWHCKNFHKSAQRKVAYVCGCSYDICIKCDYFHCSISSNISLETIHFSESAYNKWTIKVKSGFNNTTME